jgi:hypothetical protein
LILSGVRYSNDPDVDHLPEHVIVAQVFPTPTVQECGDIIYTTASNSLTINGTGFIGAKFVDLYFDNPLYKEITYEVATPFPLQKDQIQLRLRHGYKWREEPGPLSVIGIDTGGGPVKTNGDEGVRVAEVQADLDLHGVTVETTAAEQQIYIDQPTITIRGTGFNPLGNTLRFSNGILGKGVNYTTIAVTENSITLRLVPGSHWRKNVENLPGYLTLLAVNAGEGYVAVGPTNAAKERDVATVFERPSVYSSKTKLYRTHSHELYIRGVGFTKQISKTQLKFDPPLTEGVDYSITVTDRTELVVTLLDGKAWRSDDGALTVTAINSRDDEAGWVSVGGEGGIHVAEIIDDLDTDVTRGVEVIPMGVKIYQSALQETLVIAGSGFKEGVSLVFEPELKEGTDYDKDITSKNTLSLTLRAGRKWRSEPGFLFATMVKVGGKTYPLAGLGGIKVAIVLADPAIKEGKDKFHESQSKIIAIEGSGFTNVADTKVTIRPTPPDAYRVVSVFDGAILVQLKQDNDWLPSFLSLVGADSEKSIPLQVTGLDTGAGEIEYETPITIGYIVKDREGVVCDDSCEFAFDGICDDGSESEYYYSYSYTYYSAYSYGDDDLGGYYGYEAENIKHMYGYGGHYDGAIDFPDDAYPVRACAKGTDCTDCGGVDAIVKYHELAPDPGSGAESCVNTCPYARDGVCDDPRGDNYCRLGTDCQDCGPIGAENFTRGDDDGRWDDDDDCWTLKDVGFMDKVEVNRHRVQTFSKHDEEGSTALLLIVLEGMVYTVGAVFGAAAVYLASRVYHGQSIPFMNVFDPSSGVHEVRYSASLHS